MPSLYAIRSHPEEVWHTLYPRALSHAEITAITVKPLKNKALLDLALPSLGFYLAHQPNHPRQAIIDAFAAWILSVR